jgi:23S rRNA pseudouridine1911/1915/1917 synthase
MSLQVVVNFQVIAESDDWIVVNKPAPLIVHPANLKPEPTLLGGLEQLLAFEIQNGACLGIVTRLDRETSGVVLVAKHTAAARELGWIFERRQAHKEYLAIVRGWPEVNEWQCAAPIIRAGELTQPSFPFLPSKPSKPSTAAIWVRQVVSPHGRDCLTRFVVEQRFERGEGRFALVRCFPETGRMHQIRVHLASSGHPIMGDKLYSGDGAEYLEWMADGWTPELARRLVLPRHALHAAALEIPWAGQQIRWEAELPRDLVEFCAGQLISDTPDVVIWSRHD